MMIPQYNTKLFTDFYPEADDFLEDYNDNGIPAIISNESARTLYYLIYAKYGNNPIANYDENQFKYKLFAIIFQYGPTWEKRLDIQSKLRSLTEDEIRLGYKMISNRALNPETAPSTSDLEELTYINSQDTTNSKKAVVGAYADLWDMLKLDVTKEFIDKFKPLFKLVVEPERMFIYKTIEGEDE